MGEGGIHFKELFELDGRGNDLLIIITLWNNEGEGQGNFKQFLELDGRGIDSLIRIKKTYIARPPN